MRLHRRPKAVPATSLELRRGAPWAAMTLCSALAVSAHAIGGCSDETAAAGGATTMSSGTNGSASGPAGGTGGELFPTTSAMQSSSASAGSGSGSGGNQPVCDGDTGTGAAQWAKNFGDAQGQFGADTAVDAQGNVILAGTFTGTINLGGSNLTGADTKVGESDVFIAKFDATGKHLWSKSFPATRDQSGKAVAVDATGNIYLAGYFEGTVTFGGGSHTNTGCCYEDIFLAKFDANGAYQWSKAFGDPDGAQVPKGLAVDAQGNVIMVGQFQTVTDFGTGALNAGPATYDGFVAKFDNSGIALWAKELGDNTVDQFVEDVTVDTSGNVLITGGAQGTIDFGGGPLMAPADKLNVFVAKLSPTGAYVWGDIYGGIGRGLAIAADSKGGVGVAGEYKGQVDFGGEALPEKSFDVGFVARFDATGKHVFSRGYGAGSAHVTGIAFDAKDKPIVAGYYNGTIDFGAKSFTSVGNSFDIFLVKLDSVGCDVWAQSFGDGSYQGAQDLELDASGNAVITGNIQGSVGFGGVTLTASGDDAFIAKFAP